MPQLVALFFTPPEKHVMSRGEVLDWVNARRARAGLGPVKPRQKRNG